MSATERNASACSKMKIDVCYLCRGVRRTAAWGKKLGRGVGNFRFRDGADPIRVQRDGVDRQRRRRAGKLVKYHTTDRAVMCRCSLCMQVRCGCRNDQAEAQRRKQGDEPAPNAALVRRAKQTDFSSCRHFHQVHATPISRIITRKRGATQRNIIKPIAKSLRLPAHSGRLSDALHQRKEMDGERREFKAFAANASARYQTGCRSASNTPSWSSPALRWQSVAGPACVLTGIGVVVNALSTCGLCMLAHFWMERVGRRLSTPIGTPALSAQRRRPV